MHATGTMISAAFSNTVRTELTETSVSVVQASAVVGER